MREINVTVFRKVSRHTMAHMIAYEDVISLQRCSK